MKKSRYIVFCLVVMMCLMFTLSAAAYNDEYDGFRGVKWGTSSIDNMVLVNDDESDAHTKVYERNNEDLTLGVVKLKYVRYIYRDYGENWSQLAAVKIIPQSGDWSSLRSPLISGFGNPDEDYSNKISWRGKTTSIEFYNNDSRYGNALYFKSLEKHRFPAEIDNCEPCKRLWNANHQKS